MSAYDLVIAMAQGILMLILVPVLIRAVRDRTRGSVDVALFFVLLDALLLRSTLGLANQPVVGVISAALVYALPYLMLRLLIDFAHVPWPIVRASEVALVLLLVSAFVYPGGGTSVPAVLTAARTAYFVLLFGYSGIGFIALAARASGITRRRMQAVSIGNVLFALVIAAAGALAIVPALAVPGSIVVGPGILATSLAWFVGFAAPTPLRRVWQEPEIRAFYGRVATLPRVGEDDAAIRAILNAAKDATGQQVALGLLNEETRAVHFHDGSGREYAFAVDRSLATRAITERHGIYSEDPARDDPDNAAVYRERHIGAVLAAPLITGDRVRGALLVFASGPLVFPRGDLELVQLLADQIALVLESRELVTDAAQARARDEAARLREDFFAAAAHDLRSPLTTILGRAQLLERRSPPDSEAARLSAAMARDVRRLNALTDELLDASRVAGGHLDLRRERVDLADVIRELPGGRSEWQRVQPKPEEGLVGDYDRALIEGALENLIANALKYSDESEPVEVSASREGPNAHIAVRDSGIGIPAGELNTIFERFRRGSNVAQSHPSGLGLGLYICRGIVEAHGGRIWAQSEPGHGTTMHVTLPLAET